MSKKPPAELDRLTDAVFRYKPRPKSDAAKERQKIAKRAKPKPVESKD